MERVPTQTDLLRLCDAVRDFHGYYNDSVARSRGTVQQIDEHVEELKRLIYVLPKPRWFFFSFDTVGMAHEAPAVPWQGWDELHWRGFLQLIDCCRGVALAWYQVHIDAEYDLKPFQCVGRTPGSNVEILIEKMHLESLRLRELVKSPMLFNLVSDAESLSFVRDEPDYKNNVARLGDWFPIVLAICNAGGFLSHEATEQAYRAANFTGRYDNAFRKAVNTKINPELYPLGVELTATRGEGWKIELFSQTLP